MIHVRTAYEMTKVVRTGSALLESNSRGSDKLEGSLSEEMLPRIQFELIALTESSKIVVCTPYIDP